MFKFWNYFYKFLIFITVIGGLYELYSNIFSKSDYELNFYSLNTTKVIENNTNITNLKIYYRNTEVKTVYNTQYSLKNVGKKAIVSEFIYKKINVSFYNNLSLLNVIINGKNINHNKNSFYIDFELLNPNEEVKISILTDKTPQFKLNYRIREIEKINKFDIYNNPPVTEKAKNVNIWLYIFLILYVLAFIDAILLLKHDPSLQKVLSYVSSIKRVNNFNEAIFIKNLSHFYSKYEKKVYLNFLSTDELINIVNKELRKRNMKNNIDKYEFSRSINIHIKGINLYNIRGIHIFIAPLMILFLTFIILFDIFW